MFFKDRESGRTRVWTKLHLVRQEKNIYVFYVKTFISRYNKKNVSIKNRARQFYMDIYIENTEEKKLINLKIVTWKINRKKGYQTMLKNGACNKEKSLPCDRWKIFVFQMAVDH